MDPLVAWAMALMIAWLPPGRTPWPELREETQAETVARYRELAEAAVDVARSNDPLFDGPQGRERTAALLLALAYHESAFHNRVTTERGKDVERSDRGRSWCAMQILLGREGAPLPWHYTRLVPERWGRTELEADPRRCLEVGYRFARASFERCRGVPIERRLGAYTGEGCGRAPKSRTRVKRALEAPLRPGNGGAGAVGPEFSPGLPEPA